MLPDIGFSTSLKAKQNYKNPNEIHQLIYQFMNLESRFASVLRAFEYGFEVLFVEGYSEVFEDVCSA